MFLVDILFPKVCLGCGYLGSYVCISCQSKLKTVTYDTCLYCLRRSYLGLTHPGCRREDGVDGALAVFFYSDVLKKIIKNIKYRLATSVLSEMLGLMPAPTLEKLFLYQKIFRLPTLMPIPLHASRLKERGFNQSLIISQFLARVFHYSIGDMLIRKKSTRPQAQLLGRQNRYQNVRGAFITNNNYKNCNHVMLIDDIVTSGATIKEAARVLKKAGVHKVTCFTLAKGA